MNCPRCTTALIVTHRDGIEIDFCQSCQGVWLDKGELDKVVARANHKERDEESERGENPLMDIFDMFGG